MTAPCPLGVCEHPEFVHDWEEPGERPMCCIDGCLCGRSEGEWRALAEGLGVSDE